MRTVVDTNVLVSGLLWHGTPHVLMHHLRTGSLILVSSPALLAEFIDVINRPKFKAILAQSGTSADQLAAELRGIAEFIDPPPLRRQVSRDSDDDAVLALAVAAQAELIISGDADLLTLGSYAGIPVVDAAAAIARVESRSG